MDTTMNSAVAMQPIQWSSLDHIDKVRKIDDSDAPCLEEIRAVLEKHNCLERFGISLLHSHFQVADDEMMLETTNVANREHWVRPVKRADIERDGLSTQATILRFDENGWNQHCGCYPHNNGHGHSS
jgi:hypothetical protein